MLEKSFLIEFAEFQWIVYGGIVFHYNGTGNSIVFRNTFFTNSKVQRMLQIEEGYQATFINNCCFTNISNDLLFTIWTKETNILQMSSHYQEALYSFTLSHHKKGPYTNSNSSCLKSTRLRCGIALLDVDAMYKFLSFYACSGGYWAELNPHHSTIEFEYIAISGCEINTAFVQIIKDNSIISFHNSCFIKNNGRFFKII